MRECMRGSLCRCARASHLSLFRELGLLGLASGRLALELQDALGALELLGPLGKLFPCVLDDSVFLRDGFLKLSGAFLLQQRVVDATLGQSPQCDTSTHDHLGRVEASYN